LGRVAKKGAYRVISRSIITACFLFVLAAAPSAKAQTPQPLTLGDALSRATRDNLDLRAARDQRAVSLAGVRAAKEVPNPTVGFAALRDTPHESLFVDQPIEIGGRRKQRIELARQEGALTDFDIAAAERQLRRNVREAYFGFAFARRVTQERREVASLAGRLHEIAQARFDAGDIPQLEVIQAELELSRANAEAQVAVRDEQVALSRLNVLLNVPAPTSWDLTSALDASPSPASLDELAAKAVDSNAEVQHLVQEAKVEDTRLRLLKAERIPNLGVEFGADFNNPGQGGFREGARGQISMELPIFSRNQGEIAQSLAVSHALEDELAAKKRAVAGQVEAVYYEFTSRAAQVLLYSQTLVPASHHLEEMAEDSYKSGKTNILNVVAAQKDIQQVENEYLDSLLAMQTTFAELEETVGVPLE
jgi:outer membrane protein, heavy metal efflux system